MSSTLLLTRQDVESLMDHDVLLKRLKEGFAALATADPAIRGKRYPFALPQSISAVAAGGMVLAPGLVPGIPAYTVKANAKFPEHPPAIKGLVLLHSLEDGRVLAVLDSGSITAARTAAAGAVGADVLARGDAASVAIIGCGVQGLAQLNWMTKIRPIKQVYLYDTVPEHAQKVANRESARLGIDAVVCRSAKAAASQADIVITATWAREPFLFRGDVSPGTHITTLGPDGPNECEIAAELLLDARFFADDADLQIEMGAIGGAGLGREAINAEIGDVLAGTEAGRESANDLTVYGMVGVPFQDLIAAWLVYNNALHRGIGTEIDFCG